ncbi:MAG: translocation/assembly module TamB, partial [Allomuricauda sp.]
RLTDENVEKQVVLDFVDLEVMAKDFQILGPDVTLDIEALSLLSKRGVRLQNLATEFTYTKEYMRFESLNIRTKESELKGQLVFEYDREDFKEFLDKVKIKAQFTESTVSLNDVNSFYNEFGKDREVTFSGDFGGVLNALSVDNLFLQSGRTGIRGDFQFNNMFSKEAPFVMQAEMKNLTSSYYQLRAILPNILGKTIPPPLQKLGQFTIRGDAEVTETALDVQVNLDTAIGSSYADLQMTNIQTNENASYIGFISLIDFDLGSFVEEEQLGLTSMDVNVEGKGLISEYLNTEIIGQVYKLEYNDYMYTNIRVSGILKEQLFDGSLVSNDQNVKFTFEGLADFAEDENQFN